MNVFERKFEQSNHPPLGMTKINGETFYVKAIGVKWVRLKVMGVENAYDLKLDKRFFIAKTPKGQWVNGKLVGPYL